MKFDDESWHYSGDFPRELGRSAAATHIALFCLWLIRAGLGGADCERRLKSALSRVFSNKESPTQWFLGEFDGKLMDEDLNKMGLEFAYSYYGNDEGLHSKAGSFLDDYCLTFSDAKTLYHVPDNLASYQKIKPIIDDRFQAFRSIDS